MKRSLPHKLFHFPPTYFLKIHYVIPNDFILGIKVKKAFLKMC